MVRGEDLLDPVATPASAEEQTGCLVDRYGGVHLRFAHLLVGGSAHLARPQRHRQLPDALTEVELRLRGSEGAVGDPLA